MARAKKNPEVEVLPMMVPYGTYELNVHVKNPHPDRRSTRDWTCHETWHKGMQFMVQPYFRDNDGLPDLAEEILAKMTPEQGEAWKHEQRLAFQVIKPIRGYNHIVAHVAPEKFNALVANCVQVKAEARTLKVVLAEMHYDYGTASLLQALLDMGKITLNDVAAAVLFDLARPEES